MTDLIELRKNDPANLAASVERLLVRLKKITTTDDGKLALALEAEALDDESLAQVRDMLLLQQAGLVVLSMLPVQRDLFE
ncbi:MAG: hypothetical protein HQL47_09715 [Gammaproteobacteria bacterium]|nr:hypothetical protein [Gammaproteobacteria bacterium]